MQNRGGGPNETRNIILAIVLSVAIMLGFEFFYNAPPARAACARSRRASQRADAGSETGAAAAPTRRRSTAPATVSKRSPRRAGARIAIDTPQRGRLDRA